MNKQQALYYLDYTRKCVKLAKQAGQMLAFSSQIEWFYDTISLSPFGILSFKNLLAPVFLLSTACTSTHVDARICCLHSKL